MLARTLTGATFKVGPLDVLALAFSPYYYLFIAAVYYVGCYFHPLFHPATWVPTFIWFGLVLIGCVITAIGNSLVYIYMNHICALFQIKQVYTLPLNVFSVATTTVVLFPLWQDEVLMQRWLMSLLYVGIIGELSTHFFARILYEKAITQGNRFLDKKPKFAHLRSRYQAANILPPTSIPLTFQVAGASYPLDDLRYI
ncbi:MAG: hypothetical protein ORN49_14550, partial [Rhodobacteraceae bacterium]|nr:hypothetical protein [Paracoccaceae bacterium]